MSIIEEPMEYRLSMYSVSIDASVGSRIRSDRQIGGSTATPTYTQMDASPCVDGSPSASQALRPQRMLSHIDCQYRNMRDTFKIM